MDGRKARIALGAAYATNFGALAASGSLLAVYLDAHGFSPGEVADLLAVLLLVRVAALPAWTFLADRTRSVGGVLTAVTLGALVAFAALGVAPGRAAIATLLLAFAIFRAPFGALLDARALRDAATTGSAFGSVRAWGTAGFAVAALATGRLVDRDGPRGVLDATFVCLALAVPAAWALRGRSAPLHDEAPPVGRAIAELLARPRVLVVFGVAFLQEVGLAPYDALFAAHLARLGGASIAGVAVTVGAVAELLLLAKSDALRRRLGAARLLALSCAVSAVRWAAIAFVRDPWALVAIQVLHAFSFGGFYVASVVLIDEETPAALRATGQGVFGAFAFGIAAAIGLVLAGRVEARAGFPAVFVAATVASLVAAILASSLARGEQSARR